MFGFVQIFVRFGASLCAGNHHRQLRQRVAALLEKKYLSTEWKTFFTDKKKKIMAALICLATPFRGRTEFGRAVKVKVRSPESKHSATVYEKSAQNHQLLETDCKTRGILVLGKHSII